MWTFTYRLLALTWTMLCYLNAFAQALETTSTYPVVNAFDIPENSNIIITFNQAAPNRRNGNRGYQGGELFLPGKACRGTVSKNSLLH